ncbi:hypothetical protein ACNOYE_02695 [Nannocystaceae bacterium ST9]
MPPTRSLVLALAWSISLAACGGSEGLECPAAGAPLGVGGPELQPEWGAGCIESDWTAEVEPANPTWTIELRRDASIAGLHVTRLLDGVAAVVGNELILIDGSGNELISRQLGARGNWNDFVATEDGRMISATAPSGVPQYRVLAASGGEVWLRLLDSSDPEFLVSGPPGVALAEDGTLWVALSQFQVSEGEVRLEVQQWAVTGSKLSQVALPGVFDTRFARDGAGRFAVIDEGIEQGIVLFEPDGTPIGRADTSLSTIQVLGLAEGFVAGGEADGLPTVVRIDGQAGVVWRRELEADYIDDYNYSYVSGLAALPDGGVVAIGAEDLVHQIYSQSPITWSSQPFVIALDEQGVPTWGERLAVGGRGWAVTVGSAGEVYVSGLAQASKPNEYGYADEIGWLRRYDP